MLTSAREHYRRQRNITVRGVAAARRARRTGRQPRVIATVAAFQALAVAEVESALPEMLSEQSIDAPPVARLSPSALVGWSSLGGPLTEAVQAVWEATSVAFDRLVATELQDVGRHATNVGVAIRPALQGHVRYLNPPSCPRCAILAGRFYRWSEGFLRHPQCDCRMVPTNEEPAKELVGDPMQAFRDGQVRGLSQADAEAVEFGANLGRVVNVRSKNAGLTRAGRVLERAGRPTPEGILRAATDRTSAVSLLRAHGYII